MSKTKEINLDKIKINAKNKNISIFWKIYAWVYLVFIIVGSVSIFVGLTPINMPQKKLESIISLFSIVPLFLFTYDKQWLKQTFWMIFFFIFVLIEIKDIPLFFETNPQLFLNAFIGIGLSFPCYIAIFLYAFRKPR